MEEDIGLTNGTDDLFPKGDIQILNQETDLDIFYIQKSSVKAWKDFIKSEKQNVIGYTKEIG